MDQAAVKMTALQVIFDLLHSYGLDAFNVDTAQTEDEDDDESKESGGIIKTLVTHGSFFICAALLSCLRSET